MSRNVANCDSLEGMTIVRASYHDYLNEEGEQDPEQFLRLESIEVIAENNRKTVRYPEHSPMGKKIKYICVTSGFVY